MRTFYPRILVVGLILLAIITGVWVFSNQNDEPFVTTNGHQVEHLELPESKRITSIIRKSSERLRSINPNGLDDLKKRWLDLASSARSGIITEDCQQLGMESARLLLCSKETIDLIRFLEGNDLSNAADLVNESVCDLLRSSEGAAARSSLINLVGSGDKSTGGGLRFCVQWSYAAGQGCSDTEFKEFCMAIQDKECITSVILGRNLTLAETDPGGAIASTLKVLEGGEVGGYAWMSMRDQVAKLPPDSDFAAIEMLFPVEDSSDKRPNSEIEIGRKTLFIQWAKANPADAANHVMEFPERFEPSLIGGIAETVAKTNPMVGFEWARSFPAGPYFDEAAESTIAHLRDSHPQKALELASLIGDAERRQRTIDFIHLSQQPGAHGR